MIVVMVDKSKVKMQKQIQYSLSFFIDGSWETVETLGAVAQPFLTFDQIHLRSLTTSLGSFPKTFLKASVKLLRLE